MQCLVHTISVCKCVIVCSGLAGSFSSQITFSLGPERIRRIHRHFLDWEMDIPPPASNRASRFMIEGVGTRVIRGPDWKWGKQVSHRETGYYGLQFTLNNSCPTLFTNILSLL